MKYPTSNWGKKPRASVSDLWNSSLYEGANWTELDNPEVASTAKGMPTAVIPWHEAKRTHKHTMAKGLRDYHVDAFIHCYIDDQKFDGEREGIWKQWRFIVARLFWTA